MPLPPRYRFRDLILGDHHMGGVHSEDDRRYVVYVCRDHVTALRKRFADCLLPSFRAPTMVCGGVSGAVGHLRPAHERRSPQTICSHPIVM